MDELGGSRLSPEVFEVLGFMALSLASFVRKGSFRPF